MSGKLCCSTLSAISMLAAFVAARPTAAADSPASAPLYSSRLAKNSEIVFFPTLGYRTANSNVWQLEVRGCVWQEDSRRIALGLLRQGLRLDHIQLSADQSSLMATRARLFMVEQKGGQKVVIQIGGKTVEFPKTSRDGFFAGTIQLNKADLPAFTNSLANFQALMPLQEKRKFSGTVRLWDQEGITVISDIDDTIKDTRVRDRRAMLRNTFLEPYRAVPGMAQLYQSWEKTTGTQICYVSASPWQLYDPLWSFVISNGFPEGVFYLKSFRWKDKSLLNLFESPQKYKPEIIAKLFKQFPQRAFILVGDSGELDPEIYGDFGRSNPAQVKHIFIRNVTEEPGAAPRYRHAFQGLPPEKWQVFEDPSELPREP